MKKETVDKKSAEDRSSLQTEIGAITKGSDSEGHETRANQTTSTGSPRIPLSQEFLEKLGEMHDAEKRLTHALPILKLAAHSADLQTLLGLHLDETKAHVRRLEDIAESSGQKLPDKTCQPIADLLKDGEIQVIKNILNPGERDTQIVAAGRKVEQFEIDSYKPLCALAEKNDWTHEFAILSSILTQEVLAYELLGKVGEGKEPLQKLVEQASLAHAKSPNASAAGA